MIDEASSKAREVEEQARAAAQQESARFKQELDAVKKAAEDATKRADALDKEKVRLLKELECEKQRVQVEMQSEKEKLHREMAAVRDNAEQQNAEAKQLAAKLVCMCLGVGVYVHVHSVMQYSSMWGLGGYTCMCMYVRVCACVRVHNIGGASCGDGTARHHVSIYTFFYAYSRICFVLQQRDTVYFCGNVSIEFQDDCECFHVQE